MIQSTDTEKQTNKQNVKHFNTLTHFRVYFILILSSHIITEPRKP